MPPTPQVHPECRAQLCAELRAEAEDLLKHADANQRRGHPKNADWCRAAAFGCARAIGVIRRKAGG